MSSELISIIVPVYKVEKYIDRCVESIINQTYKNIEIILVDDGSPDNCPKICDEWAKKDKRIRVIHKENRGVSSARNVGIDVAKGKYIGFVDSDDYIEKEMYEMLVRAINSDRKIDLAVCDIKRDNNSVESNTEVFEIIDKKNVISAKFPLGGYVWNCLYKRQIIQDNAIRFDKKIVYGEDLIFFINYIKNIKSNDVAHVKKRLYNYSITESSINNARLEKNFQNIYNCYNSVLIALEILKKGENSDNIKMYMQLYINFFYSVFINNKKIPYEIEFKKKLKEAKEYFNLKQKIYYVIICIKPQLLYYIVGKFINRMRGFK